MSKLGTLFVGGIGYVLGARAGRERYEQIKALAVRVKDNPTVQHTARQAADAAKDAAKDAAPAVKDKVAGVASAAASKVRSGDEATVPLEDNAYPTSGADAKSNGTS